MKKITLLFTMLFLFTFSWQGIAQFGCGEGVVITDGYTISGVTTPGTGGVEDWNDPNPTNMSDGVSASYFDDDVYMFTYTAGATAEEISMTTYTRSSWNGLAIFETCTGTALDDSLNAMRTTSADASLTVTAAISAGQTVYIATGQWGTPNNLDFDVTSFSVTPITCPVPSELTATDLTVDSANLGWTAGDAETMWNLEYGEAGFVMGEGTSMAGVDANPYALTGLAENTAYEFYIQADCGAGDMSEWVGPFAFSTLAGCPMPTELMASTTAADTADLAWTAGDAEAMWNVEYGETGFVLGEGTLVEGVDANPYTLTGLTEGTTYDFYVQADCSGDGTNVSEFAGAYSWLQVLPPANDNICDAIAVAVDTPSAGDAYTSVGATAETGELEGSCFNGGINGSTWFTFVAPAGGIVTVTTDIEGGTHADTEIAVYEAPTDCADAATMGAELGCDQDGGTLITYNSILELEGLTEGTMYYIQVDRWGSAADGTFGVEVNTPPLCSDPTALTASDITEISANLGWTAGDAETMWNLEHGEAGFVMGEGTLLEGIDANPYLLEGLTAETAYEFYVQASCGDDTSEWVGPFAFTTLMSDVEINRPADGSNSIISVDGTDGNQVFCADNFMLGAELALGDLYVYGTNSSGGALDALLSGFSVYIYADDASLPDGYPTTVGAGVVDLPNIPMSAITVVEDAAGVGNFKIDFTLANGGSTIFLPAGNYWVAVAAVVDDSLASGRWNWALSSVVAPVEPVLVDPADLFGVGATSWTNIAGLISAPATSMAWVMTAADDVSIADQTIDGFSMYPNPVEDTLNINAVNSIDAISVYNLLGQEVLVSTPSTTQVQLDTANLPTGAYIVKVQAGEQVASYNLIKQ